MAKEWHTFVRKFDDLKEGEVKLFIKDLTPGPSKYDTKFVKAKISRSKDAFPDGDILWLRGESGMKGPDPWYIKIQEEMQEWVPGRPWENVLDAVEKL